MNNNNWIKQISNAYIYLTEEEKKTDPRSTFWGGGPSSIGNGKQPSMPFSFADRNPNYNIKNTAPFSNPGTPPPAPKFKPGRGNKFTKPEWDGQLNRWIIREIDRKGNIIKEYYYDSETGEWYNK
jgi:hypothetical protein